MDYPAFLKYHRYLIYQNQFICKVINYSYTMNTNLKDCHALIKRAHYIFNRDWKSTYLKTLCFS